MSLAIERQRVRDRCVCVHSLLVSCTSHWSSIAMYTNHIAQVPPSGPSRSAASGSGRAVAKFAPAIFNRSLAIACSHMCFFYVHME